MLFLFIFRKFSTVVWDWHCKAVCIQDGVAALQIIGAFLAHHTLIHSPRSSFIHMIHLHTSMEIFFQ